MLIKSELAIAMIIRWYILQLIVPFTFHYALIKKKEEIRAREKKNIFSTIAESKEGVAVPVNLTNEKND